MYKELIEAAGGVVGKDSDECALYKAEHSNCKGCKYELGCCKLASMGLLATLTTLYEPKSFDDYLQTSGRCSKIMKDIIEAQTTDEVKKLLALK